MQPLTHEQLVAQTAEANAAADEMTKRRLYSTGELVTAKERLMYICGYQAGQNARAKDNPGGQHD